eukprot:CAMPEP_0168480078 /NCGR_PEP_ID=MMETSP0228-20121227/63804_1 /TAXON_ID=133427 /ORGANISM="Protoceratium reticulatum, Strain CCCM 535 (=CCMP 1889)" /LENGTH=50 /DNA_ID=CAMNT_0008496391 /DNA_START=71 /DNA_END=219 /DNA_ORIENTATION=+
MGEDTASAPADVQNDVHAPVVVQDHAWRWWRGSAEAAGGGAAGSPARGGR